MHPSRVLCHMARRWIGLLAHKAGDRPRARPRSVRLSPHRARARCCRRYSGLAQQVHRNGLLQCVLLLDEANQWPIMT